MSGQVASMVNKIQPAKEIIDEIMQGAKEVMKIR
jgi:NAD(P)H-dependent flavin oxidoreductase YrpB (nitropropane dioxygenase family)